MQELMRDLLAKSAAQQIAMQAILSLMEEHRRGSQVRVCRALENAADWVEDEKLAEALDDLASALYVDARNATRL